MRITSGQLKKIIREEVSRFRKESKLTEAYENENDFAKSELGYPGSKAGHESAGSLVQSLLQQLASLFNNDIDAYKMMMMSIIAGSGSIEGYNERFGKSLEPSDPASMTAVLNHMRTMSGEDFRWLQEVIDVGSDDAAFY